ncbi:TPA: fibronectin binding protein [Streptococcus equi subsp. zooepidemicus]|nr:fibronectin binding protein [Streptococcus equi subsp. zooepidemicus]
MERRKLKTKSFRKVLTTSATCIVLATSFAGGTLRVWAEQLYYGWNDGTGDGRPSFLYVTPVTENTRQLNKIVYCFNKTLHWPDNWEAHVPKPTTLPLYDREDGTEDLFKSRSSKFRTGIKNIVVALVAVLQNGYPNKKVDKLSIESNKKVTQLAIWYFSDSMEETYLSQEYSLNSDEKSTLKYLIKMGTEASESNQSLGQTLDLYTYVSGGGDYNDRKPYQHLLGSSLIPKKEKPSPESVTQSNLIELSFEGVTETHSTTNSHTLEGSSNKLTLEESPKVPKIIIGQGGPLLGEEGGNSPIVEQNYGSTEGYHGQSGILEETEDTNPPGIILGGSGNVETHEDTRDPHLMGLGGGLAGESGETTPKPGQTGGHGPIIETTEDTQKGMSGQSGGTIESENTKKPEVMIGGQGQTTETTEDTQKGMSGQSGGTIESEDTKKPEVMIGGQGQIIDFSENTQSGMYGQSGDTTVIEDTKKSEIIIGGQGQIIDFSEDTQPGMSGQSGGTTIVEDTKKPTPKPKPAPAPIVNDEKPNKGTHLPQTSDMKQLILSIIGAMSMLLVLCLSLFKRPSKKD